VRILIPLTFGLAFALLPLPAAALINPCPLGTTIPCGTGGIAGMSSYIINIIFPALRVAFIAMAVGMMFYYAGMLLLESAEEQAITEVKSAYQWAIAGAGIVSIATFIVEGFGTIGGALPGAGSGLVNPFPVRTALDNIIFGLKLVLATAATAHVTIQGVRLIILQGQEGELEKQKKRFFYGLIGIVIILIASPIVNAVFARTGGASAPRIAEEVAGIGSFLLVLIGGGAVLSIIVAGALLVVSVDESLKDRAKKSIFGSVIALVIVLASYAIVNYFILT